MIKKILLISVLAATGLAMAQVSVQARPDISDIRSPRGMQEIVCERFSSRWLFSPTCQTSKPPAEPQCGNSVVEDGEECDGSAPAGYICTNQCQLVIDEPEPQCGNGIIESGEACDGSAPTGFTCTSQCQLVIDEPEPPAESQCGNSVVEDGEECDGSAPAGYICTSQCDLQQTSVVDLEQLVINEVYADVDSEHGEEKKNEWIELYNNGATAVNLLDWIIDDSEGASDIIQEEVMVAPGEFALISQATSTFEVYWLGQIPAGTHTIALGSPIGSGLANSGDALLLKSGDGIMDAMSYGNDSSIFDLTAAGAGKSLSRDPNGKDTNTSDDWIELDEPTPGF